jgi:Na+/H+ antiporter NhaA
VTVGKSGLIETNSLGIIAGLVVENSGIWLFSFGVSLGFCALPKELKWTNMVV